MEVTDSGIEFDVMLLHSEKALLWIEVTVSGNDIEGRLLHEEKASLPIIVTSPCIVTELSW